MQSYENQVGCGSCRRRTAGFAVPPALLGCLLLLPGSGHAQTPPGEGNTLDPAHVDSVGHATIQTWEEELWLFLLDRHDTFEGRFSDEGTLKRFTELTDSKNLLDLLSFRFTPMESYDWYHRDQGFRWRGGSVTTLDLDSSVELKAKVPLGGPWNMAIRMNQVAGVRADGSAVRVRFSRDLGETVAGFIGWHVDPRKSGADISVGTRWTPGRARLTAELTVLDFLNNLLYVTISRAGFPRGDTTIVYESRHNALRMSGEVALSDQVRLEVYGSAVFPSTVVVHDKDDRALGFTLDESLWYAGTLVEWTPNPRLLVAGSVKNVSARSKRTPNSVAAAVEEYELVERSTEAEAFLAFRASERWTLSGTAIRMWMPERRDVTDDPSQNIDFLLKAWLTKLDVTFTGRGGFLSRVGLLASNTRVPRGLGSMDVNYNDLDDEFYRLRLNVGWSFDNVELVIGGAYDYHPESLGRIWGTASGRMIVSW